MAVAFDDTIAQQKIDDDWHVCDLETIEDCLEATLSVKTTAINIETQLEFENEKPRDEQDRDWMIRARCALKHKYVLLGLIDMKRQSIGAQEKARRSEIANSVERKKNMHIRKKLGLERFLELLADFDEEAA